MYAYYKKGSENPADFMFRFVYDNDKSVNCVVSVSDSEQNVNYILSDSMPKALTLDEIIVRSKCDPTFQAVMNAINTQNLNVDVSEEVELTDYNKYIFVDMRNELTSVNGQVILRGHHIVVPRSLSKRCVNLALSHQGPAKTKSIKGLSMVSYDE